MKSHSDAFLHYKKSSQGHLDYVVIVCHAVPALKADLALPSATITNVPDHFLAARNPKDWIASHVDAYSDELARSTLLTVFSYFEGYVKDVLKEIVSFHGGGDDFQKRARERSRKFVAAPSPKITESLRKLQDNPDPGKLTKYQKFGRLLDAAGYRFPTDLLSNFGIRYLNTKLDEKRGMRAFEIPDVLSECLLFDLSVSDKRMFEAARTQRNKVAHGRPQPLTLKKALSFSSDLHTLAAKVDKHICEHFFVIQVV